MYLQNNKFVHSASSGGVMISDLYDDYWSRRFVSAGRFELPAISTVFFKTLIFSLSFPLPALYQEIDVSSKR